MISARWTIGSIAVMSLLVGRVMGAAQPVALPLPPPVTHELASPATVEQIDLLGIPASSDLVIDRPHYDVYGNEIEEAVGDYRVDPTGGIYESHSPDTEVAHLGPKTS